MRTVHLQRPDGSTFKFEHYETRRPHDSHKRFDGDGAPDDLPPKVDLRPQMTAVEDQQQTSSCVANATAGAYEYLVKAHRGEDDYDVSRLFIYYNARDLENDADDDAGSAIQDAIAGLKQYGACSERTWPFREDLVTEKPSDDAYEEAGGFLIEDAQVVPTDLTSWKQALAQGYPIIFGIRLFKSFDKQRKPGLVPLPTPAEASRESHGGHAMLCVGYSDADEVFIVRNSWGTDWGDDGYCYIPYDYLMSEDYNDGDSWIIRRLESVPDGQQAWSDDGDSVLQEIDGEIANMGEAEYHALLDDCGDVHFETRVAALFLTAAGADGDISDEEINEVANYTARVLEAMGIDSETAEDVVKQAADVMDESVVRSTIEIFARHLSSEALAQMANHLEDVIDADGISDEERSFVDSVVQAWQLTSSDAETGESVDTSSSDDSDDSDEEDGDDDSDEDDSDEDDSDEEEDDQ